VRVTVFKMKTRSLSIVFVDGRLREIPEIPTGKEYQD
jgi:hypothetical protein